MALFLFSIEIAGRRSGFTVPTLPVEQMHQRTCQQEQVNPVVRHMAPVVAQQIKTTDHGDHGQGNLQTPAQTEASPLRASRRAMQAPTECLAVKPCAT